MVILFLSGVLAGLLIALTAFRLTLPPQWKLPAETNAAPSLAQKAIARFGFKPDPKPEEKKYPVASIPRSQGSWRRQRLDLQKQHNSKQKERDALTGARR